MSFIGSSKCVKSSLVNIYFSDTFSDHQKFAVITPKRIGNTVIRNKCRRWLKETIVRNIHQIRKEYSIIMIATHQLTKSNFKSCHDMVLLKLKKRQLIYENINNRIN